jgi:hypothetical protein
MQPFYPFRGDRRVAFHSPPPTFCRETSRHDTAPFAHVRPMPGPESPEAPVVPPRVPVPPCARVTAILFREATGGTSGGTPRDKDEEIRVRMGKFRFQSTPRQRAVNGVFTRTCVENRGFILAPQVGFEPTTLRLTAERLVGTSRCKQKACTFNMAVLPEIGGTLGVPPETILYIGNLNCFA